MTGTTGLRVSGVHYPVTALGPGARLGIWLQGCPLACAGCMSRDTWDPAAGSTVTVAALVKLWRDLLTRGADGITVSGGEPLAQPGGLGAFLAEAARARAEPGAPGGPAEGREPDLLVYTGYVLGELDAEGLAAVAAADALVTGRFDVTKPTGLIWRGSANQELLPRTELGQRRYGPYLDHVPAHPPLQVIPDAGGVRLVGVPRSGTLTALEHALRADDAGVRGTTWRPQRPVIGEPEA